MSEPLVLISGPPDGLQYAAAEALALRLPGASVVSLERPAHTEVDALLRLAAGPLLAPLTPRDPTVLRGVLEPVLALGHDVRHVVLVRTLEDVRRRLSRRKAPALATAPAPAQGPDPWAGLAPCVETTGLTLSELADRVATSVGLRLPG